MRWPTTWPELRQKTKKVWWRTSVLKHKALFSQNVYSLQFTFLSCSGQIWAIHNLKQSKILFFTMLHLWWSGVTTIGNKWISRLNSSIRWENIPTYTHRHTHHSNTDTHFRLNNVFCRCTSRVFFPRTYVPILPREPTSWWNCIISTHRRKQVSCFCAHPPTPPTPRELHLPDWDPQHIQ